MAYKPPRLPHCLLVEDSDSDQRRIAHLLGRGTQVELTIVRTISDARAAIRRTQFDLILLNNLLPDGLGVDFAAELRRDPKIPFVPIVMISDFASPFMYDKAMAAKVSIVVDKDQLQSKHVHEALKFARVMATSRR
jgi:CheY-like chemotaxis protein